MNDTVRPSSALQHNLGAELHRIGGSILKMLLAALVMGGVCILIQRSAIYPHGETRLIWIKQLALLISSGAFVYIGLCAAMGIEVIGHMVPKRFRSMASRKT